MLIKAIDKDKNGDKFKMVDSVIIRKAIMHIMDSETGTPGLSESLLELNEEMNEFLRKHILRVLNSDEKKHCQFNEGESDIYDMLQSFDEENLVEISSKMMEKLYGIMNSNIDIPAGDVFVVTFQMDSNISMALLKMNYMEVYYHYTRIAEVSENGLIRQKTALPGEGAKLKEAIIINLSTMDIDIIEKKYEVNGEKKDYLSEMFLQCHTRMSQKTKLDIVAKAVDQINKKFYEDDIERKLEAKSAIYSGCVEDDALVVEEIGEKLFGDVPEIREEFEEKVGKYNIQKEAVKIENPSTAKKYEKQQIITDVGIEITIPMGVYNDKKYIDFVVNPDGTQSVIIKQIGNIRSK